MSHNIYWLKIIFSSPFFFFQHLTFESDLYNPRVHETPRTYIRKIRKKKKIGLVQIWFTTVAGTDENIEVSFTFWIVIKSPLLVIWCELSLVKTRCVCETQMSWIKANSILNVTKVTRTNTLVPVERSCHKKFLNAIRKLAYLLLYYD